MDFQVKNAQTNKQPTEAETRAAMFALAGQGYFRKFWSNKKGDWAFIDSRSPLSDEEIEQMKFKDLFLTKEEEFIYQTAYRKGFSDGRESVVGARKQSTTHSDGRDRRTEEP